MRLIYLYVSLHSSLIKYLGVWLLSEGSCILAGIGFAGWDKDGKPRWDGLSNVLPYRFETATNFQHLIESFNINTNEWVKKYVFKRLRFLNNRNISALSTLMFLAIWHGFAIGYFICFFFEFIYMEAEKRWKEMTKPFIDPLYSDEKPTTPKLVARYAYSCFAWFCVAMGLHFAFGTFEMKALSPSIEFMSVYYFFAPIIAFSIILLYSVVGLFKKKSTSKKTE